MATKQCKHDGCKWGRRTFFFIVGVIILFFIAWAITWGILQPRHPRFVIEDATLYNFSVNSSPDLVTSNFQITIDSRNPNHKMGIYYDKLVAHANYNDQQISSYTSIPPTYQGHHESNIWSPFITGNSVSISSLNAYALKQDQARGAIQITIKIIGKIRWKVGSIITKHYRLHVTCPIIIPFGTNNKESFVFGTSTKYYSLSTKCKVKL